MSFECTQTIVPHNTYFTYLHLLLSVVMLKRYYFVCALKKVLTFVSVFCAYGFFVVLSWNSIVEFLEGKTGINQNLIHVPELPLPAITVCPKSVFKNIDNETNKEDILQNLSNHTYTWEEVFHPRFLAKIDLWNPHEIFNQRLGVCFSMAFSKNVTSTMNKDFLNFRKGLKYQASFFEFFEFFMLHKLIY